MILANIDNNTSIFYGWEDLHKATFNPLTQYNFIELGRIKGKNYAEKKENARDLAIDYSLFNKDGLSCFEYCEITSYFEKLARRFGLVNEFKENAII